jgi:hypothetical protein
VNRVWSGYFNVGIIEPPDDMNLANPPSNEPLLDYLTEEFINHGYDMKWLHREIVGSRTYQLSWQTNPTNRHDLRNFSHQVVRRLPAEVAYDAIHHAVASDEAMLAMHHDLSDRYIGLKGNVNMPRGNQGANGEQYALVLFGKSIRSTNCDCDRTNEASLLQTMFLQNDSQLLALLDSNDSWIRQISGSNRTTQVERAENDLRQARRAKDAKEIKEIEARLERLKAATQPALSHEELVVEAYLRTLSRLPNERELKTAGDYLAEAEDTVSGMKDLLWALLNTKEFIVNR